MSMKILYPFLSARKKGQRRRQMIRILAGRKTKSVDLMEYYNKPYTKSLNLTEAGKRSALLTKSNVRLCSSTSRAYACLIKSKQNKS